MKIRTKRFGIVTAVSVAVVIMLIMTIVSAVNLNDRSAMTLTAHGFTPTVIETTADKQIVGTRDGRVICKTYEDETLWEYRLESEGALRDIVADGGELLCVTAETKEFFVLDEEGAFLGKVGLSYEPVAIAADAEHAVIYTKLKTKNQMVVFSRSGNSTDLGSAKKSANDLPEFSNIEMTDSGMVFALGADATPYRFDTENVSASPEEIFTVTNEELIYMIASGENYLAVTKDGKFVEYDGAGKVLSRVGGGERFVSVSSDGGRIVALSNRNDISYFDGNRVYKVDTGIQVSKIMVAEQGVFLIDKSDNISAYDFSRIVANHTFKILLPVFGALSAAGVVAELIAVLLAFPATRYKTENFFRRVGKALWTYKKTYLYLCIPFGLLAIFGFFPVVWGFILAFTKYVPGVKTEFVFFENFLSVFRNAAFFASAGNMLVFLVTDLLKALIPCFILAEFMFILRMQKLGYVARVLTVLPGILPGVALIYIWTSGIYGSNGLINMFLQSLGFSQFDFNWLGNEETARNALIFYGFPFLGSYILLFSALRGIPDSLIEAAKLDGCNKVRRMFVIDVPLLTPQLKYIFVTTFIASIQDFGRSYLTTGGEYGTMIPALEIYYQINKYFDYGVAAAMSLLLFVLIFIVTLANMRIKTESIY